LAKRTAGGETPAACVHGGKFMAAHSCVKATIKTGFLTISFSQMMTRLYKFFAAYFISIRPLGHA
jgi:hypothetical protein